MTLFGIGLIAVMASAFLPWTYVFGGQRSLPRALAISALVLDTILYYILFFHTPIVARGAAMNIFLLVSIHILAIAFSGLIWGLIGQGLMRRFLAAPTLVLTLSLVFRFYSLGLALPFISEMT